MNEITIITTEERLSKVMNIVSDYVVSHDDNSVLIEVSKLRWPVIRKKLRTI